MSRSQKRSKDTYQGLNVRRLPRSELDDTTMRDLNRYDNRLDHSLKTVDKAKEVMLKSLESDKNIFMRGGVRSNKKYTVQIQNPGDSRIKRDNGTTTQPSKYQSDTRNKKPVVHNNIGSTQQSNTTSGNDVISGTSKQDIGSNSSSSSKQPRDILAETKDVIDKQKTGDAMLEEYISKNGDIVYKQKQYSTSPTGNNNNNISGLPPYESRNAQHQGYNGTHSNTPAIKVDDYQPNASEFPDYSLTNGKTPSSGSHQFPFYDDYTSYGRRSHFWEYMSAPKNPSRNLQKREQLEREFSSPALKSRATTPAVPKSAKGPRTATTAAANSGTGPGTTGTSTSPSLMTSSSANNTTSPAKSAGRKKSSSVSSGKTKTVSKGKKD